MSSGDAPNWPCMVGIATLTMLVSRTDMNIPTTTTASGRPHLVVLSDGGGGAGGVTLVGRVGVRTAARGRVAAAVAEPTDAVGAAWSPSLRSLTRSDSLNDRVTTRSGRISRRTRHR